MHKPVARGPGLSDEELLDALTADARFRIEEREYNQEQFALWFAGVSTAWRLIWRTILLKFGWWIHDVSDRVPYNKASYRAFVGTYPERVKAYPGTEGEQEAAEWAAHVGS